MKIHLLPITILLGLGYVPAHAQSWCPPGAVWHFNGSHQSWGPDPIITYGTLAAKYEGDTTIGGYPAQRISQTNYTRISTDPVVHVFSGTDLFTRIDNDVVYLWDPAELEFDTLYWFGAVPGDHWSVIQAQYLPPEFSTWYIQDTGTVQMDGLELRRLVVNTDPAGNQGYADTLLERIGFKYVYFTPLSSAWAGLDAELFGLHCYRDDAFTYSTNPDSLCEITVGLDPMPIKEDFSLAPNPGSGELNILSPGSNGFVVRLFGPLGKLYLSQRSSTSTLRLNTGALAPGPYYVQIRSCNTVSTHRWIKQ